MRLNPKRVVVFFMLLLTTTGCGIHPFDSSEVAVISVGSGQSPVVSWTPPTAYQVGLYKGAKAGDGSMGEIWNKGRQTGYSNKLVSPVSIDKVLDVGETYTVVVHRKDPKGTGDGFSNTHHRYLGTKTFVVK